MHRAAKLSLDLHSNPVHDRSCGRIGPKKVVAAPFDFAYTGNYNYSSGELSNTSNGNYWSRTANSDTNAFNLNFNSGNVNPQNNNNRGNGRAVRCVAFFIVHLSITTFARDPISVKSKGNKLSKRKTSEKSPEQTTLLQTHQDTAEFKAYHNITKTTKSIAALLNNELSDLNNKTKLSEADEKRQLRETMKYAKILVHRLERTNHLHLFMFKSWGGAWWKLGGNSVAIHKLLIASCLDRTINVSPDRDTYAQFRHGVICLQDEFRLEKDIAYTGAPITLDKQVDFGPFKGYIRAYRLNTPLSASELQRFHRLDSEVLKDINKNIFASAPEVELNNYIVEALKESYSLEHQIEGAARSVLGHPLMDSMLQLRRAYYNVANHHRRDPVRQEALIQVEACIGDVMSILANYADLGIANRSTISRISLGLAKARDFTRQKINPHYKRSVVLEEL